jgi:uncharacterized protein (TIGR02231 family)
MHLLLALLVSTPARAQYREAAEEVMDLGFDLDEVQERVKRKADEYAPAASPTVYDPTTGTNVPIPLLPLEPNSDIDEVVVFRDRALVTRTRKVEVATGASAITFEGLPFGIAADSLYTQVRTGDLKIVGVELESGETSFAEDAQPEAIRAEAETLTDQLGEIRDGIEALLAQRAFLNAAVTTSGDRPMPTLDQIRGTLTYVGDAQRDLATKLRAAQKKAEDAAKKVKPLLIKLDNPQATGMTVRIEVEAAKPGAVELALRYQVFGAGWWPQYNARLDETNDKVALEYYGIVSQTTGEEWTSAKLLLSTADPSVSGDLPVLQSWYLGRDDGGYSSGVYDSLSQGAGASTTPTTGTVATGGGPVESTMSAAVQGSGSVVFAIPGRRTVSGKGSEQRLPIGIQTFGADIELASVPKVIPEVYRHVKLRYNGDIPLLPGGVAAYVGADYVGAASINTVVPGEDLSLAFGTDDDFDVQRQLVSRQQEFLGAGKKTVRYTFHFRMTVKNFGKEARTVLVSDQIPVSEIDRVTVERLPGTTPALDAKPDDPAGILQWSLALPPGGTGVIDLEYQVTAPREVPLYVLDEMMK